MNWAAFTFARNGTIPPEMEVIYVIATKFSCLSRRTGHTQLIFQPHLPHTTLNSLQPLRGLSHSRIISSQTHLPVAVFTYEARGYLLSGQTALCYMSLRAHLRLSSHN